MNRDHFVLQRFGLAEFAAPHGPLGARRETPRRAAVTLFRADTGELALQLEHPPEVRERGRGVRILLAELLFQDRE